MSKNLQENFYKRLKHLGGVTTSNNSPTSLSLSTLIDYTRANDGIALGIVKENHNYFIKKTNKQDEKLDVADFAYIGGVENKFKYQYSSLSEAEKNRNFYVKTLNESGTKQFKRIVVNESENIGNAQSNADKINADKAQGEADKSKAATKLSDSSKEVEIAKVPSAKQISVDKQTTTKVVDDTKSSSAKAIAVNKQATAKVVKENEELPFPSSEDGAAVAPAVPSPESTPMGDTSAPVDSSAEVAPEGGDENSELDAAAAALDDLGAGSDTGAVGGDEPVAGGIDTGISPEGGDDLGGGDISNDAEASVKDIEKLNGKITQKIRSTVLTPEIAKGFLKSYITAFEDKLNDLDHEDRKELANAILKDKSDDDMGISDDTMSSPDATSDADEKEIEETINAHLAEMGISEAEDETNDTKPFKNYMTERGYNPEKLDEISLMEMVSLVNGYTNECGEMENPDAQGLAEFVTSEVSDKIQESGNAIFENLMKPFGDKIKKNKKAYATEAVIPSINENFGDDEEGDDEEQDGVEIEEPVEIVGGSEEGENDPATSIAVGENEPKEIAFAPAAQVIGGGASPANSNPAKTVTLDLNNNTISVAMNESVNSKLEKIVKKKIEEALNGKKSPINESKKSALSTMIDELVNEAIVKRRAAIEKRLAQR